MSAIAIVFLALSIVLVWGGLIASVLFLRAQPNADDLPPGGEDDHREEDAPVERDT